MKVLLQNLTKIFPPQTRNGSAVTAVGDFTYEVPDGSLVALLGPSGCGKSTMLNLISGLLTPTSGSILFGEDDVTRLPAEARGIGLVFQNYALYPHLNVRQNILFPLQNLRGNDRLPKPEMERRMLEAARLVEIDGLLDRKPAQLSGGQQQRVAIARALVKQPRVLLLDEPLSNLDARLRLQTREELRRIQRETGVTTIFVTHDQDEAMSISDAIVVMRAGIFQQAGLPQEVYDDPVNRFVAEFLGTPPINMFDGQLRDGRLFIGEDEVLSVQGSPDVPKLPDMPVAVGIRPEGFAPAETGGLCCTLERVEVRGRDISILAKHPAAAQQPFRAIVDGDCLPAVGVRELHLRPVPKKVYLFDRETGTRLRYALSDGRKG